MSLNQRVFQQARDIVDQVWQKPSGINLEKLKELAYIRAIIKETLRLYSVASGSTTLEAQRDTLIEGTVIPCGTRVSWSMLAAGRDPEVYAHPEEFLPERWLDKNKETSSLPMIDFGERPASLFGRASINAGRNDDVSIIAAPLRLGVSQRSFFSGTITAKPVNLSVRSNASTLSREKLSLNLSNTAIFKNVQDSLIRVNWLTLKKICDELSTLKSKP